MQKIITLIKILVIILCICSCSPNSFVGKVESIKEDTVCLQKKCFLLLPNAPKTSVGKKAVFIQTKDKKKVNCKIIH